MADTLQGVPAIAVSLDNYKALTPEGFMAGAAYVVALIKASNCPASFIRPSSGHPCHSLPCFALLSYCMTALLWRSHIAVWSKSRSVQGVCFSECCTFHCAHKSTCTLSTVHSCDLVMQATLLLLHTFRPCVQACNLFLHHCVMISHPCRLYAENPPVYATYTDASQSCRFCTQIM